MAELKLPDPVVNEVGWGPTEVPDELKHVPFAPFTKTDKLGRASDWTSMSFQRVQAGRGHAISNVFNFAMDTEDGAFHLVDSRPIRTKQFGPRHRHQQHHNQRRQQDKEEERGRVKPEHQQRTRQQQQKRSYFWRDQRNTVNYSPSVEIRPEWSVLEQIQVSALAKLNTPVGDPTEYLRCGSICQYERAIDRVTPKNPLPLVKTPCVFRSVTASDDPVLQRVSSEGKARVFITDSVLTALMCTPRSVYSWDILITRRGNEVWFDKRTDSVLDKETVNETALEGVQEDDSINGVQALALEATAIRQNFSQQCLDKRSAEPFGETNPFAVEGSKEELSSVGYVYRIWNLGEDMNVAVRCEVDGAITRQGQKQLLCVRTFNQAIVGTGDVDWKRRLEHQSAAVMAMELKNNSNRVARWTMASMLAGADSMKVGFTTRVTPKDNQNHLLLVTQLVKPKDLAQQMNINMGNCWAILRHVVDLCLRLEKDNYVLMKDPNKPVLYLYEVPSSAFKEFFCQFATEEEVAAAAGGMPAA